MGNVLILLATYNGEKYIREMIDSIINQDYTDWKLVLSDDSSSDSTPQILDEYAEKYSEKVVHYKSGKRFGNAQNHFMHLLSQYNDAPYIMFCDQDDVWHSDKIRKTLDKMREIEKNSDIPAMVHTDLRVVDQNLSVMDSSFIHFSKLDGNRLSLKNLLVQNVVTGCTMMINRKLAEFACRIDLPKEALMHDWWLAIICSVFGTSGFLNQATIDYRQHGNNSVGANNVGSLSYLWKRFKAKRMKEALKDAAGQAEVFLSCFQSYIPEDKKVIIEDFVKTKDASIFIRNYIYIKHRIFKKGILRILAQLLGG